ncbi:tRNA pseudouridine(38-40) synthase TruA [Neomicrococcus lactis]|uniref:tRNA pseudouridine(38-40) synthase TruA n=1 Tax=Neomicrococcus lactis TaxID=732241 RepID=UPI0022FFF384|nr:tRNA pseudouridine(38-40) synthase TruA [Neomicrococcus lactis]
MDEGWVAVDATASAPALVRMMIRLAYDGAAFAGWARQPGLTTVQGRVEEALALIVRRDVRTVVAGRTDAGVHARGQVVHCDLTEAEYAALNRGKTLSAEEALKRRLNGILKRTGAGAVVIHETQRAPEGFDARFSALWRRYSYRTSDASITVDPLVRNSTLYVGATLDVDLMNREAQSVLGHHDFLSFCKPREGATTLRTLQDFRFERDSFGYITAHLQADAFCHSMVRSLIGASLLVGEGREEAGWLRHRLELQVRDSRSLLAPPHPLVLEEVKYPEESQLEARANMTRARRRPVESSQA